MELISVQWQYGLSMQRLSGKIALITGGNSGIGLAAAKLFRENGARLAITGRDQDSLDRAKQVLGNDTLVLQSDAGELGDIERAMQEIQKQFGRLDILFVNAGSGQPGPFENVTEAQFDEISATNFKGMFFTIQKALPLLADNASIIVTTSVSNQKAAPNFAVYAACKAAQRSLVQTLGFTLAQRGIRVNAISPGPIDTGFSHRWGLPPELLENVKGNFVNRSPMKRFGTPEEVAKVALFLASDDSSYVTGEEIVVDGGVSLPLL